MKVGIIADDLIGANSAAAPFRRRGLSVDLRYDWTASGEPALPRADVLALDTETRHASQSEAIARVREAAILLNRAALDQGGPPVLLKHIDSAMRGPIGAELEAMLAAYPGRMAIVAPSFPTYRHTVDMGQLQINGHSPAESGPEEYTLRNGPPPSSYIADIIGEACQRRCAPVGLGLVRGGSAALSTAFEDLAANGIEIAVCDALENADLEAIAHVLLKTPGRFLAVGSAGLAGALVNHLAPHGDGAAPTLIINGSLNPRSINQSQYLIYHWHVKAVELDLDWVLHGGEGARFSEVARCLQEVQQSLTDGLDTIITPRPVAERADRPPEPPARIAEIVGDTLGEIASAVLSVQASRNFPLAGLVLVGGSTALRVCRKLGGVALAPHSEVMPGIAAARLQGGTYHNTPIITKPGSLGPDNALAECARYLKRSLE